VAELVQRYGYEGYPIVDRSQNLIGLLNRRSVERAQVFKLDPSIESIMNAGNFSVKPGDSVEYLKELMSLSGWGQIPVIERNSSEIIGIVTRTDLIKTLTGRSSIPGNRNYAQLLQRTLPTDALTLIKIVAETAYNCHYPVYIVGGFVRDLILEKPVMDFDIVVEGDAVHLARMLVNLYGGKVKIHAKFGTAKWMIEDIHDKITRKPEAQSAAVRNGSLPNSLDLISARTEFYDYPTAMPKVERSSIKLDLHRRDFTINTLALRLDGDHFGDLLDFWGGFLDLQQKLIRVLHSLSFTDDPTRMLRAIRFENRFNFAIEKNTRMQLMESRMLLKRVSGRRIINELELFFREENPAICLSELEDTGLLAQIHPAMRWHTQQTKALQMLTEAEIPDYWLEALPELPQFLQVSGKFLIWLGDHPVDVINEIGKRLQLSQASLKMLKSFSELRQKMPEIIQSWPSEQTFFLENQSLEAIYCYDCLAEDDRVHHSVQKFLTSWRYLKPFTTGSDLRKQPYPAGNWISGVLKRLRKGWIDEEISSREEEQKTLDYILPIFTKGLVPKGKNPIAD
jgi:tRNA nucleotidyltransferase (CCA-adding enzyme)